MLFNNSFDPYTWPWVINLLISAIGALLATWMLVKDHTSMSMVEEIRHDLKYLAIGIGLFFTGILSLFPLVIFTVLWVIDTLDG